MVHADWCCILTVTSGRRTVSSIGSVPTRVVGTDPIPVVCARWCPTLPHPGGCSTIGAVRLSFRVRDGSGRFPVAVTTETTTWAVRQCSCDSVIRLPANTHTRMRMLCVWLVVGLGVDRIVDALRMLTVLTPRVCYRFVVCAWGVLLFVSAVLVPVSSRPLLVFHFWPINPVVCWGPTRAPKCPVETLS